MQRVLWHKLIRLLAVVALFTGLFNAMPPANAVVLFQAAGAASSSTGNATPAWPAHQVGDIGLLFIETGGSQSVSFISQPEWVQVTGSPQTTNPSTSAGTRLTVYWARANSSTMATPTINDPGDHIHARILTYRGAVSSGNPWDVTSTGTKSAASTSVSVTGLTTTVSNTLIVQAVSRDNDASGAAFSAQSNSNLGSLTERADDGTTSSNGGGIAIWDGTKAVAGATGNTTATVTSSQNAFLSLALKPAPCTTVTTGATVVVTCTADSTVAIPTGVTFALVEAWGGGGGGDDNGAQGGGGGGGGAYASATVTVVPGTSYGVTIGAGGAAGSAGSFSQFDAGAAVKAEGGSAATAGTGGAGGATGTSVGTTKRTGGAGGAGQTGGGSTRGGGGGGGSATPTATGGAGAAGSGGAGGNGGTGTGAGGDGGDSGAAGAAGAVPGGGGGGGGRDALGSSGASGQVRVTYTIPPIAHYQFDEASWSGTTGEVIDSTANAYHATRGGSATTATGSPAYTVGAQSTCNYGRFDAAGSPRAYVQLPSAFPSLSGNYSITAWVRTTDINKIGQRVFVRDDADNGWALSVSDEIAGTLRLFNRNVTYSSGSVTGGGALRAGNVALDTPVVITNNTWYFIAVTVDVTNSVATLYVYNSSGTQLAKVSASYTGTWGPGTGATSIGNETAASAENGLYFSGNIDEVRFFAQSLSQTDVESFRPLVRTCVVSSFNHLRIEHDGEGLTCLAEQVTVRACTDSACSSEYAGSVTTTLSPAGWVGGDTKTFSGGNATYSLAKTTTGSVTLGAASTTPTPTAPTRCFNGATETCAMNFVDAGFIFSSAADGTELAVTSQTAGTAFGPVWLRAVKTSTTTKACEAAISTPQAVDFDYDCANPGTCSTGNYMTIGASTVGASATGLNLSFDANGNANLGNISYQDVGSITLKASATVGGVTLAGTLSGSGGSPFVVKPASFTVSQSACADGTLNTVSQSAPATGNAKFCRAGQNFTAKVTALNAAGNATPNYGNETPAEKVGLGSWGVQLPSGGAPGTLPTATFTGAPASGTLTANATSVWNEVGILKATAAVGDANYLGAGNISNTVYFGRFYPDHFDTTITPATGCSGFVYAGQSATVLGQPFTVTTTAKSGASTPTTTTNYTSAGGFAKNIDLSLSAGGSVGKLYVGNTQTGTNAIPATTFVAGIGEVNFAAAVGKISYSFDTFPTSPTPITLHGVDADTGTALIASTDAGTTAHAGRLRLLNAYGSDLLPLRVPFQTEYYNASTTWTISNNDSCTTLPSAAIALGSRTPPGVGSSVSSVVPVASGVGTIVLAKPSSAGTIDLAAGLTGSATAAITASSACLSSWSNGPNTTTGAALDYLTSNWCGSVFTKLPAARIKFGSPKAPFIYQRETY